MNKPSSLQVPSLETLLQVSPEQIDVAQVPVVLRNVSDNEILEVSILENIQRENLTVIEEAQS